jgi:AcrR family transcriptional regulator
MCGMPPATHTRRERERDIVDATRALFDERGLQDAPIEEIARAVGINKALIYRVFASKEELFVLTVTTYLDELRELAADTDDLRSALDAFTRFCLRYPAFLDCALSLMRRPAPELEERVGEGTWLRLGRSMAACLAPLAAILEAEGVEDPDFTANRLYTQVLGTMHLARVGVAVREAAPGVPGAFPLDPERVRAACVDDALALVRSAAGPRASTPPAADRPPARA